MPWESFNPLADDVVARLREQYGDDAGLEELCRLLSVPPRVSSLRVNTLRTTPGEFVKRLGEHTGQAVSVHPHLKDLVLVQGDGPLDVVPVGERLYIDRLCAEAVLRGAEIYAIGVVGGPTYLEEGDRVAVHANLCDGMPKGFATDPERSVFVGNGVLLARRSVLIATRRGDNAGVGVDLNEPVFRMSSLNGVLPDLCFAQTVPSCVVGHMLDPQPGETVLDMCAAPGGKTTHIAALMRNRGVVVALDRPNKVGRLVDRARTLGLDCIHAFGCDSTKACVDDPKVATPVPEVGTLGLQPPTKIRGFPPESFDRILLDGPCSALGLRPKLADTSNVTHLESCAHMQQRLIKPAARLLKPGGVLVYSTCTLNADENERIVALALKEHGLVLCEPPVTALGRPGLPGCGLTESERKMVRRFDPRDSDSFIGFFCAVMTKKG